VFHFPNPFVDILFGDEWMNVLPLLTLIVVNIKIDAVKKMTEMLAEHMVIVVDVLDCRSGKN
jgi:hypothetical protein